MRKEYVEEKIEQKEKIKLKKLRKKIEVESYLGYQEKEFEMK